MKQPPEIINDFLPEGEFYKFAVECMTYPHYSCCDYTATEAEADGSIWTFGENLKEVGPKHEVMWQAVLYNRSMMITSDFYKHHSYFIEKLTKLLNVKTWWLIRVNCTTAEADNHVGHFHNDYGSHDAPYLHKNCKTAILYLNTNNCGTKFHDKDGPFVQSKANTLIKFPTSTKHAGVWCTNAKLRYVLNLNYEENE
tara:strand:+ start:230 stop:820 length:591 start_codon:yes stop_codon:yes gene_type:complete